MALNQHLAWVLGAVALIAAFLTPSMASAHTGHGYATPVDMTAAPQSGAPTTQTTQATVVRIARSEVVSTAPILTDSMALDCESHCCGGLASMACCVAALAAEMSAVPTFAGVRAFLLVRAGSLPGLAPEALPKPPKSFA